MNNNELYATPKADLIDSENDNTQRFFPASRKKLVIMYFATLGLYKIYWFYKHWDLQKSQKSLAGDDMIPLLRALFYVFFTHSLFKRIEDAAEIKNISKSWSAGPLATLFVILTLVSNFLDRISMRSDVYSMTDYIVFLLLLVLLFPIYAVQGTANQINNDAEEKLNSEFSIYNIIFILIGLVFWFLILVAALDVDVSFLAEYLN